MFTVCIEATDQGDYKVYVEQPEEAMEPGAENGAPVDPGMAPQENTAEEANEPGAQTFPDIKGALTAALEALKNEGAIADTNGQDKAMQEGFNSVAA
jgi:hypothetical protein